MLSFFYLALVFCNLIFISLLFCFCVVFLIFTLILYLINISFIFLSYSVVRKQPLSYQLLVFSKTIVRWLWFKSFSIQHYFVTALGCLEKMVSHNMLYELIIDIIMKRLWVFKYLVMRLRCLDVTIVALLRLTMFAPTYTIETVTVSILHFYECVRSSRRDIMTSS